jgi:HPt (histidine-containing phosphotransfer) domain-containing protein/HAMP domain-containing protein
MKAWLALLGPDSTTFWSVILGLLAVSALVLLFFARKRFGLKLGLAVVTISVGLTATAVFYFYSTTYQTVWTLMGARIKDIVRTGLFLADQPVRDGIVDLQQISELRSMKRDASFLEKIGDGGKMQSLDPIAVREIMALPHYQAVNQTMRRLKSATRQGIAGLGRLPQQIDPADPPAVRYAYIVTEIPESPDHTYVKLLVDGDNETLDTNGDGQITADEEATEIGMIYNSAGQTAFREAFAGKAATNPEPVEDDWGIWITGCAPVHSGEKIIAALCVDMDARSEVNLVRQLWYVCIAIVGIGFLLSISVSGGMAWYLNRPVGELYRAASRLRKRDYEARAAVNRSDELGVLAAAFNGMAAEVGDYARNLERKVDDRTRELRQTTDALLVAKAETDSILSTVTEGLFLIRPDSSIRSNYSASLERLLSTEAIGGLTVAELLANHVSQETVELTDRFLRMLFDPDKDLHFVLQLNPLDPVEFRAPDAPGGRRILKFRFSRIIADGSVTDALCVVTDLTESVELERQMQEERTKTEESIRHLLALVQVPPAMSRDFLDSFDREMAAIDAALANGPAFDALYRHLHSIKGNAAALKMEAFAEKAHALEEIVESRHSAVSSDLLNQLVSALREGLAKLRSMRDETTELLSRLHSLHGQPAAALDFSGILEEKIKSLVSRRDAPVDVDLSGFHAGLVPQKFQNLIADSVVQFARNSLVHGIEDVQARTAQGKPERAVISLESALQEGQVTVSFRDDGRGLDIDKIRAKALERGLLQAGEDADAGRVLRTIFEPGFSTLDQAEMDGGRGVGLDLVKSQVQAAGGRIQVSFSPGKFTRFVIFLPAESP